ncbi:MAG: hypothetical protein LUH19_06155 [Lachnospiraceae bacterium]|nr:hypothetical protein [Lachnospiraceae bacterium]
MLIDLSGVFQSESGNIHLSYTPGFTSVRYRGQDFSISEKSPVTLDCVYE